MKDDEAAALVREAYGLECDEVGFFIAAPLSAGDIAAFARSGSDMQYGEVLPAGMAAIARELGVGGDCERLCELGSGTGKQALHLFLRHENVVDVLAVELSRDRCDVCRRAWRRVAAAHPTRYALDEAHWASASTFALTDGARTLRCHAGDLLEDRWTEDVARAQVLVLQTCFPPSIHEALCRRVLLRAAPGARVVSYHAFELLWTVDDECPFSPLPCTVRGDKFPTSWQDEAGYAFSLYVRDGGRASGGLGVEPRRDGVDAPPVDAAFREGDLVWTRFAFWPVSGIGEDEWDPGVVLRANPGGGCVVFYEASGEVDYDVPAENIKARATTT